MAAAGVPDRMGREAACVVRICTELLLLIDEIRAHA